MVPYAFRRPLWSIPVIIITSHRVFVAVRSTTNPAAQRCPTCRAEDQQRLVEQLNLDEPAPTQYVTWLGSFSQGDFGKTLRNTHVWPDLRDSIIVTLQL